ncbi:MAG: RodZ domain-containing protein, partial [Burkholderiaceae bacterium]
SREWVVGIAVVGLIALGIVGWQSTQPSAQVPVSAAPTPTAAPSVVATAAPAQVESETAPASASEAVPSTESASTDEELAPPVSANSSEGPPALLLRFTGPSWVEVTGADGKIVLSELSVAGAEHALNGELPLMVVIGDVNTTSVEVRGEAFNLQPFTRNNVARFTVE